MAQKSSVRARAYMENEHVLKGVEELQGAAIGSYCYETLEDSIHSQLYLAEILLLELDLGYLAKHVSMAAAWVAGHSDKPGAEQYLPEAFLVTARCELMLGNWARTTGFLIMSGQAAMLYLSKTDDEKMRSVLNLGMLCALNKEHELKLHIRGALNNGLTKDEIKEVFLQVAIYCGVPAAVVAFRAAREVFQSEK